MSDDTVRSLAICAVFIVLSSWCTLYNKFIFESVFRSSNALLLVQNVTTIATLWAMRAAKLVDFSPRLGCADILVGLCYGVNVMFGLWSLVFVNIAMFGALKRCTVVASWVIELLFTRTSTTMKSAAPITVMTVGTVVASFNDLQFSAPGYAMAILSCITQAGAFELGRRLIKEKASGVVPVLWANSVASTLLLVPVLFATGEMETLAPAKLSPTILGHFFLNSVSCLLMNYSVFLNCSVNSPLAHAVTGNMKAVVTTVVGVLLFAADLLFIGWVGVVGNFGGAAWFSYQKWRQKQDSEDRKAAAASTEVTNPV